MNFEISNYIRLFYYVFEEFILYDHEGNIFFTLHDISEENILFNWWSNSYEITLVVTQEMVEAGRQRYTTIGIENND